MILQVLRKTKRRLFLYDIGGQPLLGLGPVTIQGLDHLCIVQGARIPFVVRETAEPRKYTLIGEAFTENFMHGELQLLGFADREIFLI